jgi:hypothetical protein
MTLSFKRAVIIWWAFAIVLIAFMLQGCATLNVQLTKKDVVTWALTIYSDQYDYL